MVGERSFSFRERGGWSIYWRSEGSPAKARAPNVSIMMFTHSIWITVTGVSTPRKGPIKDTPTAHRFMLNWNTMNFRMLKKMVRPNSTACIMEEKRSSVITISPASRAASVPLPMANPTSAARSAGASLMPSPVIPTTSPLSWERRTRRLLSVGKARATTAICGIASDSSLSVILDRSSPVSTRWGPPS